MLYGLDFETGIGNNQDRRRNVKGQSGGNQNEKSIDEQRSDQRSHTSQRTYADDRRSAGNGTGERIKAAAFLDPGLAYFEGHFPGAPVMPGVLTVEAMAQTADVLLLSAERYAGRIPYFIGIDEVKFKKKIEPGDEIVIEAKVAKENKEKAVVTCEATVYNGGEVSTTGLVTLAMR